MLIAGKVHWQAALAEVSRGTGRRVRWARCEWATSISTSLGIGTWTNLGSTADVVGDGPMARVKLQEGPRQARRGPLVRADTVQVCRCACVCVCVCVCVSVCVCVCCWWPWSARNPAAPARDRRSGLRTAWVVQRASLHSSVQREHIVTDAVHAMSANCTSTNVCYRLREREGGKERGRERTAVTIPKPKASPGRRE